MTNAYPPRQCGKAVVELLFTKLCNMKIVECSLRFDLEKKLHKEKQTYAVC